MGIEGKVKANDNPKAPQSFIALRPLPAVRMARSAIMPQ